MTNLAKRKHITSKLILQLIDVAIRKGHDESVLQNYWNTYHCLGDILTSEDKLHGKFCKNRICTICNAIHKAELINKYLPVLKTWKDPHFITLTVKSVTAKNLTKWMGEGMIRGLKKILNKNRLLSYRGKSKKLIGIRSLECNFNPIKRTYNPHFHILVPDKETGELIINEWLNLWGPKHTAKWCQDIRPVEDIERDIIETIKYGTKIFTDPTVSKFKNKAIKPFIYISAIDNILQAMRGKRLYGHFGFTLPRSKAERDPSKLIEDFKKWEFVPKRSDWVNIEDWDKNLLNFEPDEELSDIIKNNIDNYLE